MSTLFHSAWKWSSRVKRSSTTFLALVLFTAGFAYSEPDAVTARLVIDVPSLILSSPVSDQDVISVGSYAGGSMADLADAIALPPRADIDALIVTSNAVIFSLDQDVQLTATIYADEDLLIHTGGTSTVDLYLDSSAIGIPGNADIDAACFEGGPTSLLFSIRRTLTLPDVGLVADNDVVRWNGTSFSVMASGVSDLGVPEKADIDALHHDGSNLFFSLNVSATIQAQQGADRDVWKYDLSTADVSLLKQNSLREGVDLAGLDERIDSDDDGLSDYEELTGQDEPGTTFGASGMRLDPEGHTSDPNEEDTDFDSYSDAQEAFLGTDPDSDQSMLEMANVERTGAGDVVTWQSVPGRIYDVDVGRFLPDFTVVASISNITASVGVTTSITNPPPGSPDRIYRVKVTGLTP